MPEFTGHNDLRSYWRVLWRWKLLFLGFLIALPVIAYLIESGKPPMYRASALVGINQASVSTALLNSSGSFSTTNIDAIAQLVTTTPVADVAAGLLHPPGSPGEIAGEVTATANPDTGFLTISASDRSAVRAAAVANAFARAIGLNRQNVAVGQIDQAIRVVRAQAAHLSRRDPARTALEQQLSQLQAAKATQGSAAAILQAASPPGAPSGPNSRRTLELALVIGLLLGLGAVALAEGADRRLRAPDDLETMSQAPLLATIPPSAFSGGLQTAPEDDDAFHTLRTALLYFVDRTLQSIVITSPGEKDGKTTVSTRLALVTARAGQKVILVDGDLRRAQVSSKFSCVDRAGMSEVLSGERSVEDVLVTYQGDEQAGDRLQILPAGGLPLDPAGLLTSSRLQAVIRQLESRSDFVIIDTPAALAVSDAVPLMRNVGGVVMVARMNQSTREPVQRLHRIITSAHGKLVGVVATGVGSGMGYEHYAPRYYTKRDGAATGGGDAGLRRWRKSKPGERSASAMAEAQPVSSEAVPAVNPHR